MLEISERHFRKPRAVLRAILESPQGIVIFALDERYRYLAFNQNHARTMKLIWGVDIHVGDCMLDLIGRDDDREKARRNFDRALAGESFTIVEEYGDESMHRRVYEDVYSPIRDHDGSILGLAVYLTDVTQQRQTQLELDRHRGHLEQLVRERTLELEAAHAKLLHAQKLESLGVLAGGIAHDFNNLLAVVLGRAELAIAGASAGHPAQEHMAIIRETALEARMLTRQLLGYAGKGTFVIRDVNLNEMLDGMSQLLRASIRKSITLSFQLAPDSVAALVDETQVRQIVLNLVTNAAEAIGDEPGSVTVRTSVADLDEALLREACIQTGVSLGPHACIEVEDTGSGMDENVRARLFDPFFTTKFAGRGLGLAAVLGIVTSHHGTILVRTAPKQGSCFRVLFPLAPARHEKVSRGPVRPRASSLRAEGLALVVDDEEPVRAVTTEILTSLGYRVLQADGGRRACELFRSHAEDIRLVLLDLTMPGLSGEQTFRELKAIRSDVRVIVLTGYAGDEASLRFAPGDLAGFLTKPFVRDELVETIQTAQGWAPRPVGHILSA